MWSMGFMKMYEQQIREAYGTRFYFSTTDVTFDLLFNTDQAIFTTANV